MLWRALVFLLQNKTNFYITEMRVINGVYLYINHEGRFNPWLVTSVSERRLQKCQA